MCRLPQILLRLTIAAGPDPNNAYAIFTPSLVFAYWMRGSITRPRRTSLPARPEALVGRAESRRFARPHRPHPHRLPYPFQRLLAAVLERNARGRARQRAYRLGPQPLARRGEAADAGGDVHGAAVDVVGLADDVAGVEAEVQGEAGVVAGCGAGARSLDRLARSEER